MMRSRLLIHARSGANYAVQYAKNKNPKPRNKLRTRIDGTNLNHRNLSFDGHITDILGLL